MMRLFLDQDRIDLDEPSVARAIELARDRAAAGGRIVVEVLADGSPLADELLESPPEDDAGIGELRMVTTAPGPFIRVTLMDTADALEQARSDQDEAARCIQEGRVEQAFEPLQRALATWVMVRDVVEKAGKLLDLDPGTVRGRNDGGEEIVGSACIESLLRQLEETRRSLAMQDWAGLSDVLAYDLDGQVARWRSFLVILADRADPEAGEGSGTA